MHHKQPRASSTVQQVRKGMPPACVQRHCGMQKPTSRLLPAHMRPTWARWTTFGMGAQRGSTRCRSGRTAHPAASCGACRPRTMLYQPWGLALTARLRRASIVFCGHGSLSGANVGYWIGATWTDSRLPWSGPWATATWTKSHSLWVGPRTTPHKTCGMIRQPSVWESQGCVYNLWMCTWLQASTLNR